MARLAVVAAVAALLVLHVTGAALERPLGRHEAHVGRGAKVCGLPGVREWGVTAAAQAAAAKAGREMRFESVSAKMSAKEEPLCPKGCSGHGTCDIETGKCRCDDGYVTESCEHKVRAGCGVGGRVRGWHGHPQRCSVGASGRGAVAGLWRGPGAGC